MSNTVCDARSRTAVLKYRILHAQIVCGPPCGSYVVLIFTIYYYLKYHAPVTNLVPPRFAVFALEK